MQNPMSSISSVGGIGGIKGLDGTPGISKPTEADSKSFAGMLGNALGAVNTVMDVSKQTTQALATGDMNSMHEMTIAGAKAEVAMKLTTTIASKLASATTTLFQMQL